MVLAVAVNPFRVEARVRLLPRGNRARFPEGPAQLPAGPGV